jgi:hypothetical protein
LEIARKRISDAYVVDEQARPNHTPLIHDIIS